MTTTSQASQSWGNSPELLTFGLESLLSSQKKLLLGSSLFSQTGSKKLFWKMRRKPLISVKRYLQYGTAGIAECQIFLKDKSDLYSPFSLKFFFNSMCVICANYWLWIYEKNIFPYSGQTGRLVWKFWQIYFKWSDYIKQHGGEKCTGVWR